jgi:hypothetical protein
MLMIIIIYIYKYDNSHHHDVNNNHPLWGIQSCSAMFPPCVDASAGSVASASVASEMLKDGADGAEQSGWRLLQLSACDILEVPKRIKRSNAGAQSWMKPLNMVSYGFL